MEFEEEQDGIMVQVAYNPYSKKFDVAKTVRDSPERDSMGRNLSFLQAARWLLGQLGEWP